MAVDYTKVFTVIGSYIDKINDYYSYIAIFDSDKDDIDTILADQSLVRLESDLPDIYNSFKSDVSSWTSNLISKITTVLTDNTLIGANFAFGTDPSLDIVWPALIHDMNENSESVDSSVSTIGAITYDGTNASIGTLVVGTLLDGVTPPIDGAPAIKNYSGLATQLTPDSETLVFTCTSDSENGATRGSETFEITGTLAGSDPFSPGGQNIGNLGSIQVADNNGSQYLSNGSFDSWTSDPDSWNIANGTLDTEFLKSSENLQGSGNGFSFQTLQSDTALEISQELSNNSFIRSRGYFLSIWAQKDQDLGGDQSLDLTLVATDVADLVTLTIQPTTTAWQQFSAQFIAPVTIDELILTISTNLLDSANDAIRIDQLVITPCEYHSGVAVAIFGGPDKFLIGDTISLPLSNDSDGAFQAFFRKAFSIQLPTSNSPTIIENLVT